MNPRKSIDRTVIFFGRILTSGQIMTILLFLAAAFAATALGGVWSRFRPDSAEASKDEAASSLWVETLEAVPSDSYTIRRSFTGTVEASRRSQLAFERGGLLTAAFADEGDAVEKGAKIAALDAELMLAKKDELRAALERETARLRELTEGPRKEAIRRARADVERAGAELELAERTAKRFHTLVERGDVTRQRWDEARLGEEAARAQLRAAEAALEELETGTRPEQIAAQRAAANQLEAQIATLEVEIGKSTLFAPFGGVVLRRFADEGRVLGAGEPVLELAQMNPLEVRIGVTPEAASGMASGDSKKIHVRGAEYPSTVKALVPERERATRTVDLILRLGESANGLRLGDLAELWIEERIDTPGFWLPLSALTEDVRGLWNCRVAAPDPSGPDGQASVETRVLEVIHTETGRAYVSGSLREGERVIASGSQRIVPGQRVRVREGGQ